MRKLVLLHQDAVAVAAQTILNAPKRSMAMDGAPIAAKKPRGLDPAGPEGPAAMVITAIPPIGLAARSMRAMGRALRSSLLPFKIFLSARKANCRAASAVLDQNDGHHPMETTHDDFPREPPSSPAHRPASARSMPTGWRSAAMT